MTSRFERTMDGLECSSPEKKWAKAIIGNNKHTLLLTLTLTLSTIAELSSKHISNAREVEASITTNCGSIVGSTARRESKTSTSSGSSVRPTRLYILE